MARSTNGPASRKRRKKVLKYARGYFGNKSKLFRYAKEAVQHAWQYAYAARKKKKADSFGSASDLDDDEYFGLDDDDVAF